MHLDLILATRHMQTIWKKKKVQKKLEEKHEW